MNSYILPKFNFTNKLKNKTQQNSQYGIMYKHIIPSKPRTITTVASCRRNL